MILSNVEIHRALDDGKLILDPEPSPRFPAIGVDCPYQASAVDLTLGDEISWLKEGLPLNVDLRRGGFARLFGPNSDRCKLTSSQPFMLEHGRFVLGKTHERVALPIRDTADGLAARIEGRSSYSRFGLLVHFTAPTIHAGFDGTITLELCNLGPAIIALYPRAPICQLIVETVHGLPFRNDSQFQGQRDAAGTRRLPRAKAVRAKRA